MVYLEAFLCFRIIMCIWEQGHDFVLATIIDSDIENFYHQKALVHLLKFGLPPQTNLLYWMSTSAIESSFV